MGIVRVTFVSVLILFVAIAPIFCPCHNVVIGFSAPGVNPASISQCADASDLASGDLARGMAMSRCHLLCRCDSTPLCLDHLFKGVLRESAAATMFSHIGHSNFACPTTSMNVAGTATFCIRPQLSLIADTGTKTLLRQHCALII